MKTIATVVLLVLVMISATISHAQPLNTYLLPTSCRVLDTRVVNGPIQANEIRIFSIEQGFSTLQGGVSGCYVPTTARGVKINVKGRTTTAPSGYFRVFNAEGSVVGIYSTLQLHGPVTFDSIQVDVPIGGSLLVAIHSIVEAHAIVDLVGWFE